MPNPFPGMNPYLENPNVWPSLHSRLINEIADAISSALPPGYAADVEERLYVVQPERHIIPDITLRQSVFGVRTARLPQAVTAGGTALAVAEREKPNMVTIEPWDVREFFVQVLSFTNGEARVVTTIELLSPSNKTAGSVGREKYLAKQQELLGSDTHFLEIDLLRGGAHTLYPPREMLWQRDGAADYAVTLHRAGAGSRFEVWTRTLRDALPHQVLVPLADGEPDITFDLQALLDRCYDIRRYESRINYENDPVPPLHANDADWADALLREKGLRSR